MDYYFSVAGHSFRVVNRDGLLCQNDFFNYMPFCIEPTDALLFEMEVRAESRPFPSYESFIRLNDEAPYIWLNQRDGDELYGFSLERDAPNSCLQMDSHRHRALLFCRDGQTSDDLNLSLNNALMLLYALFSSPHKTLLLHSSLVIKDGQCYSFLGQSGTGKSTHSDLWVKYLPHAAILNDDNPVVRIIDHKVKAYGSPWSGKRDYYINSSYSLKALVLLEQAPENRMKKMKGIDAFVALLSSCSCIRWNRQMADAIETSITEVISLCDLYHLKCLPDKAAAELCYAVINGKNI